MTTARKALLTSKSYLSSGIRLDLFRRVQNFLTNHDLTRKDFAEKLGFSKGYVSQVLNGDADVRISKLVELGLAIGLVPVISWMPVDEYIRANGRVTEAKCKVKAHSFSKGSTITQIMAVLQSAHGKPYRADEYAPLFSYTSERGEKVTAASQMSEL